MDRHMLACHELATFVSLNISFCRPEFIDSSGSFLFTSSVNMDRWSTTLKPSKGGWTAMSAALKAPQMAMNIILWSPTARYTQPESKFPLYCAPLAA